MLVVDNNKYFLLMWPQVSQVWGDLAWALLGLVLGCCLGSDLLRVCFTWTSSYPGHVLLHDRSTSVCLPAQAHFRPLLAYGHAQSQGAEAGPTHPDTMARVQLEGGKGKLGLIILSVKVSLSLSFLNNLLQEKSLHFPVLMIKGICIQCGKFQ